MLAGGLLLSRDSTEKAILKDSISVAQYSGEYNELQQDLKLSTVSCSFLLETLLRETIFGTALAERFSRTKFQKLLGLLTREGYIISINNRYNFLDFH